MASDDVVVANEEMRPFTNPRPALVLGVVAALLGCLLLRQDGDFWTWSSLLLLGLGLLATGAAVAISPRSPAVLGIAAFVALVAAVSVHPRWDSIGLLLGVLAGIAAAAAVLMLLPQTARRVVVSVFILFHFTGILTAVTGVEPTPWVTNQLWTRLFRPYLQFTYLINAYHFYSPEPGPAEQLWFRIAYTDDAGKVHGYWHRIPNRAAVPWYDPVAHSYQRRLSLTEMVGGFGPASPNDTERLRLRASVARDYPSHPQVPELQQCRIPIPNTQRMLQSYARHVWWMMEQRHPDWHITAVRIYRVQHSILPAEAYDPRSEYYTHPDAPQTFLPFYEGEYDRDGQLKDPTDPMLCWLVPILRIARQPEPPAEPPSPFRARVPLPPPPKEVNTAEYRIVNYLKKHAGDEEAEEPLPPYDGEWK